MQITVHRLSAIQPTLRKHMGVGHEMRGNRANRFRFLQATDGSFRVELFAVGTCRHCGKEALEANWPTRIDFPAEGLDLGREVLRENRSVVLQTEIDPDEIQEMAPEDYCSACWIHLGLE